MNKGTAIVGFFMSFLAGMFLMWGLDKGKSPDIQAEAGSATGIPDQSSASVRVSARDPQWGKPDAPVTIVAVSDFQCPFCSRVEPTLKQVRDKYGPNKVRMVWKNNPLPFHNNRAPRGGSGHAVFGLKGSEAFWKFHDTAFANQQSLSPENYEKWRPRRASTKPNSRKRSRPRNTRENRRGHGAVQQDRRQRHRRPSASTV